MNQYVEGSDILEDINFTLLSTIQPRTLLIVYSHYLFIGWDLDPAKDLEKYFCHVNRCSDQGTDIQINIK